MANSCSFFCPRFRAEFSGPLEKMSLKVFQLPQDDYWVDGTYGDIRVRAMLSTRYGLVRLVAHMYGYEDLACRRTLAPVTWTLDDIVQETIRPHEEPDLFSYGLFDMAEWVRQQLELLRPAYPVHPALAMGEVRALASFEGSVEENSPFLVLARLKSVA